MSGVTCPSCGKKYKNGQFFCTECGKYLLKTEFDNNEAVSLAERKLNRIMGNLKENPHTYIWWNHTVDGYVRKVERIESLLHIRDMEGKDEELTKRIEDFLQLCRKPDFEIAFTGAVKAGKSTLINALLGGNYASTDPNPETAVLTKFRSSEQDFVHVKFYSEEEWSRLWVDSQNKAKAFLELYEELGAEEYKEEWIGHEDLYIELSHSEMEEELKKWSSSKSAMHFFVKEIEVGISSLPKDLPKEVVFVDTPGLFDPVEARSKIAEDYIERSNAVFLCIKADSLHKEEIEAADKVFTFAREKKNKVFVIATNWDKLNNVITDWEKRYEYIVNSFTGNASFPNKEVAKKNILYSAAFHYTLCQGFPKKTNKVMHWLEKIQDDIETCDDAGLPVSDSFRALKDLEQLSEENMDKLMEITNIPTIHKTIHDELIHQYTDLMETEIKISYKKILDETAELARKEQKVLSGNIKKSFEDVETIEQELEQAEKDRKKMNRVQKQLRTAVKTVEKSTEIYLNQILEELGS